MNQDDWLYMYRPPARCPVLVCIDRFIPKLFRHQFNFSSYILLFIHTPETPKTAPAPDMYAPEECIAVGHCPLLEECSALWGELDELDDSQVTRASMKAAPSMGKE